MLRGFFSLAALVVLTGGLLAGCASQPQTIAYQTDYAAFQPNAGPQPRVQTVARTVLHAAGGLCGLWSNAPVVAENDGGEDPAPATEYWTHTFTLFGGRIPQADEADAIRRNTRAEFGARLGSLGQCNYEVAIIKRVGMNAFADRERISITSDMVRFAKKDAELAFVIGHEVAHNLLGHQAPRDEADRHQLEIEADYVGLYLVARAGYNLDEAAGLLDRMASAFSDLSRTTPTHPTFGGRYLATTSTLAEIRRKQQAGLPLIPDGGPIWSAGLDG